MRPACSACSVRWTVDRVTKTPERADPAAPRPRLPASFWIMIAFGLVCILAGVVIGHDGPRLFPIRPAAARAAPAPAARPPLGKPAAPG